MAISPDIGSGRAGIDQSVSRSGRVTRPHTTGGNQPPHATHHPSPSQRSGVGQAVPVSDRYRVRVLGWVDAYRSWWPARSAGRPIGTTTLEAATRPISELISLQRCCPHSTCLVRARKKQYGEEPQPDHDELAKAEPQHPGPVSQRREWAPASRQRERPPRVSPIRAKPASVVPSLGCLARAL